MNEKEVRWKERRNKPGGTANKYFPICDEVRMDAERVIIPDSLQHKILKHLKLDILVCQEVNHL